MSDDVENYEDSAVINDEDDLEEGASAKPQPISGNAFSFMMSSHKENEIWKEASQAERKLPAGQRFNNNAQNGRRKAPFYKVLTGMPIAVDAFKYGAITGVSAYFLTYVGLSDSSRRILKPLAGMRTPTIIPIYPQAGNTGQYTARKQQPTSSSTCCLWIPSGYIRFPWTHQLLSRTPTVSPLRSLKQTTAPVHVSSSSKESKQSTPAIATSSLSTSDLPKSFGIYTAATSAHRLNTFSTQQCRTK